MNNWKLTESNFDENCIERFSINFNPTFYYHKCLKCASNTKFYEVEFLIAIGSSFVLKIEMCFEMFQIKMNIL